MYSDSHKSTSGLMDVMLGHDHVISAFEDLFERQLNYKQKDTTRNESKPIYIIDTFFSDTLNKSLWRAIVGQSILFGTPIQIILLNPFSEFAIEREKSLQHNGRIKRLNKGLSMILEAIDERNAVKRSEETEHKEERVSYLYEQIAAINNIRAQSRKLNLEIKFSLTCAFPLYIFGEYACVGQFLATASAIRNPWLFWVDCPQNDDQYDYLVNHFKTVWDKHAEKFSAEYLNRYALEKKLLFLLPEKPKVFVGYGKNEIIRNQVINICNKYKIEPLHFDNAHYSSISATKVTELLDEMYNSCSCAIIILTCDDDFGPNNKRCRQNVLLELGECRVRYGDSNVLLLVEPGLEMPTNRSGIIHSTLFKNNNNELSVNVTDISDFFHKVDRRINEGVTKR